jgi:hypothetical protein
MNQPPELNSKDIRTISYIFAVAVVVIALMLLWASRTISAQEKPKYTPTEVQLLRLQVIQKDAFLLKAQMQDLQRQFGDKVGDLQRTAEKIKLEQGWPPETSFDMDKLTFSAPPPKEEKK